MSTSRCGGLECNGIGRAAAGGFRRPLRSLFERRAKGEGLEKRAED